MARSIAFLRPFWLAGLTVFSAHVSLAGPYTDPGVDASQIAAWASDVDEFWPGPVDIANPSGAVASFGLPENALGPVDGDSLDVCSLGDGGPITFFFDAGIGDGAGDDFAVFENGFYTPGGFFGEFAFVEVSSNGDRLRTVRLDEPAARSRVRGPRRLVDPSDFTISREINRWASAPDSTCPSSSDDPLVIGR